MKTKSGFTVVETLIVITVTSVLLVSALATISGRQGRTQFVQGIRETEALLKDTINDVGNGILPSVKGLRCTTPDTTSQPVLAYVASVGTATAGNQDCVLAGKIIQFGTGTSGDSRPDELTIYEIAGRRAYGPQSGPVTQFSELKPIAIHPKRATPVDDSRINATVVSLLPWGIELVKVTSAPPYTVSDNAYALGMLYKDFRGLSLSRGGISSGTSAIGLMRVADAQTDSLVNMNQEEIVSKVDALTSSNFLASNAQITLCFKSASSNQYATITISDTNGLTTKSEILNKLDGVTCS